MKIPINGKPIYEASVTLHEWRWRFTRSPGPPASTTRLVLLVLSIYMDRVGECWPSIGELACACALSERAIGKHIRLAEDGGWIRITRRPRSNYRRNTYLA
ncbi:hypothetical protein LCGC14_2161410, partial [marine sediment metagenome]